MKKHYIYPFRINASPEGVLGQDPIHRRLWFQRPRLWAFGYTSSFWAFVAPMSSSMSVWVSVVFLGVCGSVVLFYRRLGLRRPFGRLDLRRLWAFVAPSSSSMGV